MMITLYKSIRYLSNITFKMSPKILAFNLIIWAALAFIACSDPLDIEATPELTYSNTGPYIINMAHLGLIRENEQNEQFQKDFAKLIRSAEKHLDSDFEYVTDKIHIPPSGDIHDYMSLARYLWPNDETGEYDVIRDGVTNPLIYEYDRPKLAIISKAIYELSLAYALSPEMDERFAAKASELIYNWFLNLETRMNPNLNYAQVALGFDEIRRGHQGIVDTNDFIRIIEGVSLIYDSTHWTNDYHQQLKVWFYHFNRWISREYNRDAFCDEIWCNNISTWMDAQKTIYFLFTEQEDQLNSARAIQPISEKISKQFDEAGRQPAESQRALSQHYYYFNLRGYAKIALLRKNRTGFDRDWNTLNTSDFGGIKPAFDIIVDYLSGSSVNGHFNASSGFDDCRYLDVLRPAAIAFNSHVYEEATSRLLDSGCSAPDITLAFPDLNRIDLHDDTQ